MISGKLYDGLKYTAQIFLPALGTLYFTLAGIWNLSSADKVVGTIMAVDFFLGLLLGLSQVNYNKQIAEGVMNVEEGSRGQTRYSLELDGDPAELPEKKEVHFKVQNEGGVQHEA